MKPVNLSKLLKNYSSGWIAITSNYKKVVASGKTLKEVTSKVAKQERDDVVLISASRNYRGYVTTV